MVVSIRCLLHSAIPCNRYFGLCFGVTHWICVHHLLRTGNFYCVPELLKFKSVFFQTRLLMKIHAYVRSNAGKVLNYKPHSDQQLILPTLQHFVYFLFAPTLVYCDEYPKYVIFACSSSKIDYQKFVGEKP